MSIYRMPSLTVREKETLLVLLQKYHLHDTTRRGLSWEALAELGKLQLLVHYWDVDGLEVVAPSPYGLWVAEQLEVQQSVYRDSSQTQQPADKWCIAEIEAFLLHQTVTQTSQDLSWLSKPLQAALLHLFDDYSQDRDLYDTLNPTVRRKLFGLGLIWAYQWGSVCLLVFTDYGLIIADKLAHQEAALEPPLGTVPGVAGSLSQSETGRQSRKWLNYYKKQKRRFRFGYCRHRMSPA